MLGVSRKTAREILELFNDEEDWIIAENLTDKFYELTPPLTELCVANMIVYPRLCGIKRVDNHISIMIGAIDGSTSVNLLGEVDGPFYLLEPKNVLLSSVYFLLEKDNDVPVINQVQREDYRLLSDFVIDMIRLVEHETN